MGFISYVKTWSSGEKLFAADLEAMKASITAQVNGGLDDSNIIAAADITLSKLGDYSANDSEMQVQTDPYPSSVISKPTDIRGEFARLRFILKSITGSTYWYQGSTTGVMVHTTGDVKWTIKSAADTGWILLDDGTISNAAGGGTTRANADTVDLFTLLWTNFTDAQCPLSSGTRAGDATAAVSYAANKTLRLPLMVGRAPGIAGTPNSANVCDSYSMTATANGGASATRVYVNNDNFSPADVNGLAGSVYTLEFDAATTTVAIRSETRTITTLSSGSNRFFTVSSAFSGVPTTGDIFTIYKTVTTRTLGDAAGYEEHVLAGDEDADYGASSGGVGVVTRFANGTASISALQPTYFINCMVKL